LVKRTVMKPGQTKSFRLPFATLTSLKAAKYNLIGSVTVEKSVGENQTVTVAPSPVTIAPPFVDLQPAFTGGASVAVSAGHPARATITVRNIGNATASGTASLSLYAARGTTLDDNAK